MRLDRWLANLPTANRRQAQLWLASGEVRVNGECCRDAVRDVREFDRIEVSGALVQAGRPLRYFMLHKPPGCVSATVDPQHPTVLDLLDEPDKHELHIAGRLDFNTSGLMIITNDGLWSRRLTQPTSKLPKHYLVETEQDIGEHYVEKFRQGFYFAYEDLTTQPAELTVLAPRQARLAIVEGRYHQVKRMFGFFDNKVVGLHRETMGPITLDPALAPGEYRPMSAEEIQRI